VIKSLEEFKAYLQTKNVSPGSAILSQHYADWLGGTSTFWWSPPQSENPLNPLNAANVPPPTPLQVTLTGLDSNQLFQVGADLVVANQPRVEAKPPAQKTQPNYMLFGVIGLGIFILYKLIKG